MNIRRLTFALALSLLAAASLAQNIATTRNAALDREPDAPKIPRVDNSDVKQQRNYPMQPPLIPHKIDNYQVDLYANKCMSCHSRKYSEDTQATMISVTHYMDRDGNFLADISPRRYFCSQCHVPQHKVNPHMDNDFEDIDKLLRAERN